MSAGLVVWVGNFDTHVVPKHLEHVLMTRSGWPDKRKKKDYATFFAWVAEVEQAARVAMMEVSK